MSLLYLGCQIVENRLLYPRLLVKISLTHILQIDLGFSQDGLQNSPLNSVYQALLHNEHYLQISSLTGDPLVCKFDWVHRELSQEIPFHLGVVDALYALHNFVI